MIVMTKDRSGVIDRFKSMCVGELNLPEPSGASFIKAYETTDYRDTSGNEDVGVEFDWIKKKKIYYLQLYFNGDVQIFVQNNEEGLDLYKTDWSVEQLNKTLRN